MQTQDVQPATPSRLLALTLAVAATLCALSLALVWHRRLAPGALVSFVLVRGIDADSWLAVVAALCTFMAVRFLLRRPGFFTKWLVTVLAFVTTIGVFADYIDDRARAASMNLSGFNGPGFYLALAVVLLLAAATVLAWRNADPY